MRLFILKDGRPLEIFDMKEWGRWHDSHDCEVTKTEFEMENRGNIIIQTIFMGFDATGIEHDGEPKIYRTRIMKGAGSRHDSNVNPEKYTYATIEEALAGHKTAEEFMGVVMKEREDKINEEEK